MRLASQGTIANDGMELIAMLTTGRAARVLNVVLIGDVVGLGKTMMATA